MQRNIWIGIGAMTAGLALACGPKRPDSQTSEAGMGTKYEPKESHMGESEFSKEKVDDGTREFDQAAADIVLKRGARKAAECSSSADTPPGEGEVEVVFDGEKGRIVDVKLPFTWESADERAQSCIKNAFIGEYVPPFEGGPRNVSWKIEIAEAKPEPKTSGPKKKP